MRLLFISCLLFALSLAQTDWKLVAQGSEGDDGCQASGVISTHGYGNDLEACQDLCIIESASFMHYHADTFCACYENCDMSRPASDFGSVADVYEWAVASEDYTLVDSGLSCGDSVQIKLVETSDPQECFSAADSHPLCDEYFQIKGSWCYCNPVGHICDMDQCDECTLYERKIPEDNKCNTKLDITEECEYCKCNEVNRITVGLYNYPGLTKYQCAAHAYEAGVKYINWREEDRICVWHSSISTDQNCQYNLKRNTKYNWKVYSLECAAEHTCPGTMVSEQVCESCKCQRANKNHAIQGIKTQEECEYKAFDRGFKRYSWRDDRKYCVYGHDYSGDSACIDNRKTAINPSWGIYTIECEIPGCTVPEASNFDIIANTDDGSCEFPCEDGFQTIALRNDFTTTGCRALLEVRFYSDESCSAEVPIDLSTGYVYNDGYTGILTSPFDYTDDATNRAWFEGCNADPIAPGTKTIGWTFTAPVVVKCVKVAMYNTDFVPGEKYQVIGSNDGMVTEQLLFGATKDTAGSNYGEPIQLTALENSAYVYSYETCSPLVQGCMDPAAGNYDPTAEVDDGSCLCGFTTIALRNDFTTTTCHALLEVRFYSAVDPADDSCIDEVPLEISEGAVYNDGYTGQLFGPFDYTDDPSNRAWMEGCNADPIEPGTKTIGWTFPAPVTVKCIKLAMYNTDFSHGDRYDVFGSNDGMVTEELLFSGDKDSSGSNYGEPISLTQMESHTVVYSYDYESCPTPEPACGFTTIALVNEFTTTSCHALLEVRFYSDESCSDEVPIDISEGTVYNDGYTGILTAPFDYTDDLTNRAYMEGCNADTILPTTKTIGWTFPARVTVKCVKVAMLNTDFQEGETYRVIGSNDGMVTASHLFNADKDSAGSNYGEPIQLTALENPFYFYDQDSCP